MGLLDDALTGLAAHLVEAHDVVAGRGAQRLAGLAGFEAHHDVGEHGGDLRAAAPTEGAALERGLAVGVGDRELREVLAGARAAADVLGASCGLLELTRRRVLRHGDEDVGDVVLARLGRTVPLLGEELLDLARRDVDALQHIALAQHLHGHLAPYALAIGGVVDPLRGERLRQFGERQVVALRHIAERLVQGFVVDEDAGALGALHLDLLHDEPLEHLLTQDLRRRHLHVLRFHASADLGDLLFELAVQHHAVVHHRGHPVEHLTAVRERARLRVGRSAERGADQGEGERCGRGGRGAGGGFHGHLVSENRWKVSGLRLHASIPELPPRGKHRLRYRHSKAR